jgi:protein-S-isoprenylcysteine O-methyltransferase Ste14
VRFGFGAIGVRWFWFFRRSRSGETEDAVDSVAYLRRRIHVGDSGLGRIPLLLFPPAIPCPRHPYYWPDGGFIFQWCKHQHGSQRRSLQPLGNRRARLIGLLLAFFSAYTDRLGLLVFGGNTLRLIGVVLFTVGGVLRLWPVFVLGGRFSGLVAIQERHTLVMRGIYRRIRNPSYLDLLVNMLGWALTFRSGVGVLLTGLTIPILIARITSEERLLREHFGAEYDAYCARTWRLIPWIY